MHRDRVIDWVRRTGYDTSTTDTVAALQGVLDRTEDRWFVDKFVQPSIDARAGVVRTPNGAAGPLTNEDLATYVFEQGIMNLNSMGAGLAERFGCTRDEARLALIRNPFSWKAVYTAWGEYLVDQNPEATPRELQLMMSEFLPPLSERSFRWFKQKRRKENA